MDIKVQLAPENIVPGQYRRLEAGLCLIGVIGCAFLSGGCSKHEAAGQPVAGAMPADTNQNPSVSAPPPADASAPVVAASPDGGADLRQLNHIYISWIVQNRRRAKSFDDFVSSSGAQVPPAPAGKKYVIDNNGFIALANQ